MNELRVQQLRDDLARLAAADQSRRSGDDSVRLTAGDAESLLAESQRRLRWLAETDVDEARAALAALRVGAESGQPTALRLVAAALSPWTAGWRRLARGADDLWTADVADDLAAAYDRLAAHPAARGEILRLWAEGSTTLALPLLADRLAADPPSDPLACAAALAPLVRRRDFPPAALFPRLLDALAQRHVAAAALDIASYTVRAGLASEHPAAPIAPRLIELLGELVQRLELMNQRREAPTPEVIQQVNEAVSLAVSCCHALALIGVSEATGKLRQALDVPHRRIRTEAAYALARLGEEAGIEALDELAREPVARLRVLAYAEELGLLERIDEPLRTPPARAEAEAAAWLSEPQQLGFAPHELEPIDHRRLYWPGYDEPVDCWLFRFAYHLPGGVHTGIVIAGPLVHSFPADLADLPVDAIYAAFAGWHAQHADIVEFSPTDSRARSTVEQFKRRLADEGFTAIEPVKLGKFFGDAVLVATAEREGVEGVVVIDSEQMSWAVSTGRPRPLGPDELYSIYKGKRLLEAFNRPPADGEA